MLEDLDSIGSAARTLVVLQGQLDSGFRRFASEQRWEFKLLGRLEAGAHFAVVDFLDRFFVQSSNASAVFGMPEDYERPDLLKSERPPGELDDAEVASLFEASGSAQGLARMATEASEQTDRLRFELEREACLFGGIVP